MVIGNKFAWAHIPKTGGDSTHLLFRELKQTDLHFIDGAEKHNSFRVEAIAGLNRISNIRRLPSLLKSWAVHYSQHSRWNSGNEDKPYTRGQLLQGLVWWLEPYTSNWQLVKIDDVIFDYYELDSVFHWIRTENLLADFKIVLSNYADVSGLDENILSNTGRYQRKMHFSRKELRQIYSSCPRWRSLEQDVYGGLLSTDQHYRETVDDSRVLSILFRNLQRLGV